jgi:hypothetical protein
MRRTEAGEQAASSGSSNLGARQPAIGRAEILRKYWELANLDPEVTKGTITGQLKALDSLCEELALEESGDDPSAARPQQQIYRSAWLREAAREVSEKETRTVVGPRSKSAVISKRLSSARTCAKVADDE